MFSHVRKNGKPRPSRTLTSALFAWKRVTASAPYAWASYSTLFAGRRASFDHDAFDFDGHNLKVWQVGWARGDSESELALVLIVKSPSFYAQTWVCLSQTPLWLENAACIPSSSWWEVTPQILHSHNFRLKISGNFKYYTQTRKAKKKKNMSWYSLGSCGIANIPMNKIHLQCCPGRNSSHQLSSDHSTPSGATTSQERFISTVEPGSIVMIHSRSP